MSKGYISKANGGNGKGKAVYEETAPRIRYLSDDMATYESDDEILEITRTDKIRRRRGLTQYYSQDENTVVEAKSDGKGNLKLEYAKASETEDDGDYLHLKYKVKTGIAYEEQNQTIKSAGINWDKVKTISGRTYDFKSLLKEKGMRWDGKNERWYFPNRQ